MAVALVGSSAKSNATSVTFTAADIGSPVAGNVVVAFASDTGGDGGGGSFTPLTPPAGFTSRLAFSDENSVGDQSYVASLVLSGGFSSTTFTGTNLSVVLTAWSGVSNTNPVESVDSGPEHAFVAATTLTANPFGGFSAASTNMMLLAYFSSSNVNAASWNATVPSGMTALVNGIAATSASIPGSAVFRQQLSLTGNTGSRTGTKSVTGGASTGFLVALRDATNDVASAPRAIANIRPSTAVHRSTRW